MSLSCGWLDGRGPRGLGQQWQRLCPPRYLCKNYCSPTNSFLRPGLQLSSFFTTTVWYNTHITTNTPTTRLSVFHHTGFRPHLLIRPGVTWTPFFMGQQLNPQFYSKEPWTGFGGADCHPSSFTLWCRPPSVCWRKWSDKGKEIHIIRKKQRLNSEVKPPPQAAP